MLLPSRLKARGLQIPKGGDSKVVVKDRQALLNLREPFNSLSKLALAAKSKSRGLQWWAVEDLNL